MSPKQELILRFQVVLTNSDQLGLPLLYTYEHKFALHSLNNDEMEEVRTDYEEMIDDNFLFQGHHHHHHCRQVHLPLTEFAAFFRGQQVEDAPPLDLTKVTKFLFMAVIESTCFHKHIFYSQIGAFGLQTFGGVYDNFKQSGAGALEIDSISLY